MVGSLFHEKGGVGVVEQVVEQMFRSDQIVGDVRAFVGLRIHAYGSAVDNHFIFVHDFGSDFSIGDCRVIMLVA